MANWTGTSRNDTKSGTSSADRLNGRSGNDRLYGLGGDDILTGGAGSDVLDGGTGVDTAVFAGRRSDFEITTSNGVTTVRDLRRRGPEGTDTLTNIERLVFTDGVLDLRPNTQPTITAINGITVTEDHAVQTINLLTGAVDADGDALSVVSGSVQAASSNTARTVAVTVNGNSVSIDPAQFGNLEAGQQETVTVTYTVTDDRGTPVTNTATLTITGAAEAPVVDAPVVPAPAATTWTGTSRSDTRSGTAGDDHMSGRSGNDKLSGLGGDDTLVGGAGNDTLNGGDGTDTAVFAGRQSDYRITTVGGVTTVRDLRRGAPDGTDTLTNIERIVFGDGSTLNLTAPTPQPAGSQTVSDSTTLSTVVGTSEMDTVTYTGTAAVGSPTSPYVLAQGVENFETQGSADVSIAGNALNNVIGLGTGADNVDLSTGGADTVTGTAAEINGANISGFGTDDKVVVEGAPAVKVVGVRQGSAILDLDTNGDGVADATIRLEGDGLDGSKLTPNDFTVTSANGGSTIAFAPKNDAPVAQDGDASGDEDAAAITGTVAATDADSTALTYSLVEDVDASTGTLTFNADGSYSFTPAKDYNGPASFTYKANDGTADSNVATVRITVAAQDEPNTAPVATGGDASGDEDTTITGQVGGTDAEGAALTYKLVAPVEGLTLEADGSYSFTPAPDFHGSVEFQYIANDGELDSAPQTVTITVTPVDEVLPVASIADASASEAAGSIEIPVTLSEAASQGVTLTYEVSAPGKTISFDGTAEGSLPSGYEGVRWTNILGHDDGSAIVATAGGQFQALDAGGFTLTGLTLSTDYLNQLGGQQTVTFEAIKDGAVVGTKIVTLTNGAASADVAFGADFSGIDTVRIDAAGNSTGSTSYDAPIRIDNVVLAGGEPTTGTVTIAAGQTTGSITIPVVNDSTYEVGETVTVRLTGAQGATLGQDVESVGTITNDDPEPLPLISIVNVFTDDVQEGLFQEFEVTRDSRIDEPLTVEFESALFGNQLVTFQPGETKVWATFGKADDQVAEPNQPYEITLAPSPNYLPGAVTSVSGNYIDNDGGTLNTAPTASSSVTYIQEVDFTTYGGSYSLAAYGADAENDKLTYTLVGDQPEHGTISFDPDVGGMPALMFTPNAGFLENLDKGEQATFTYQFTVSDGEFTTAPMTGTVMVFGDGLPPGVLPTVSVTTADVTEGGSITYTFTRDGSTAAPLNVDYTLGGTAMSGSDYTAPASSVTFWAGSSTATVTVRTTNDTAVESAETVALTLAASSNYTIGQGTATSTIADNDTAAPDLPTISVTDVSISEGGNLNFRFPMSAASAERLTVAYEIVYGTATADDVSYAQTGTFIIAAGQANRGLNVLTIEDLLPEVDETFTFRITSVTTDSGAPGAIIVDGEGVGTITNDDQAPAPAAVPGILVQQTGGSAQVTEAGVTDTFTIALATAPTADVTVEVSGDGWRVTPVPGDDYGWATLTFTPTNWNVPQTVAVAAIDDTEANEVGTGGLFISVMDSADPAYDYLAIPNGYVSVSVTDNDTGDTAPPAELPVINATSASAEVTEGGVATFGFTRSGDLSQALTVAVDTSIGLAKPGTDFTAPTTITFAAGSDTATLEVQTLNDGAVEALESIEVRIAEGTGYTIGAADGNVTDLLDDQGTDPVDPEPVRPALSISDETVNEGGIATFTVTLSAATTSAVSVDYALSGSAGLVSPATGTLTFAPGETSQTIEVPVSDNLSVATGTQQFVVNLSNVSANATLADLVGQGTILDDDLPTEMPALTIETTTGLTENSTISWNAVPGAATYTMWGYEPDDPTAPPHLLHFVVGTRTSYAIAGNDEFAGMAVYVTAEDEAGNVITRSVNETTAIENVNDVPTGQPVVDDMTPEVGQTLTISIGDLDDGDGMRVDRPDEFGYIWQRSEDGVSWSPAGTGTNYTVTQADNGFLIRGAAQYVDRGDLLETVYTATTGRVGADPTNTPANAVNDTVTTAFGAPVSIDVLANDTDAEGDAISVESFGQAAHGVVTQGEGGQLVYTANAGFSGTDTFTYTVDGGDAATVSVTVADAEPVVLSIATTTGLTENSTLLWNAVPGAATYTMWGYEPDDPTAPPHLLGFVVGTKTSYALNGNDEFTGMAIYLTAEDESGNLITRSVNETTAIENINDVPTGNLSVDNMTPEVGQTLTLGYGTFEDGDGYRDRGRAEEFEWAWERSQDGVTWTTIVTGASAGEDGPFGFSYTVTQADNGYFLRGRAIYEDRAGDTIETVYSLSTSKVGATLPGDGGGDDGSGTGGNGTGGTGGDETGTGSLIITMDGDAVTATELGANGSFAVALAEAPTADVTVTIMGDNQVSGQAADGLAEMIFTTENWDTPQTVTVIANEDGVDEGPHTGEVWLDMFSDDPRYAGAMQTQSVNVTDSAPEVVPPYVSVAYLGGDVEEGGEITFDFMRREGVNTNELAIDLDMVGLDASDIEKILWNGSETGVKGFRAGTATATMTVVLADDAIVEGPEALNVTVLFTEAHFDDFDNFASATVLDNDVAIEEPVNQAPVAEPVRVDLTEDNLFAEITPSVTDADGNPTTVTAFGALPTGVTFDETSQRFVFNGDPATFDALNTGEAATVSFQYVANDGVVDSAPATVTITIAGITDQMAPQKDPEPAQPVDQYNYDQGNGGPAGLRTAGDDILNDADGSLASNIAGHGGNDTIYGKGGNDTLVGGMGDDTIHGGSGDDQITGDGGNNALNTGLPGSDSLYGGDGTDTINGSEGNDIIVGGHGADNLTGGPGDDTFVFHDIFDRGDTITMQGQLAANDVFDFRTFDFDPNAVGQQGPVTGLQIFNQAPAEGQMLEDAFYYDRTSGKLSLNTGTDGLEDFSVTLLVGAGTPLPQVNANDFLI